MTKKKAGQSAKRRLRPKARTLALEPLEHRRVLSVSKFPGPEIDSFMTAEVSYVESDGRTSFRNLSIEGFNGSPEVAAVDFLETHAPSLGLPQNAAESLGLIDTKYGLASQHVYFQQLHAGLPVHNGQLNVSFGREGDVQTVHTSFVTHTAPDKATAIIDQSAAVKLAHEATETKSTWIDGDVVLGWYAIGSHTTPTSQLELAWKVDVHARQPDAHDLVVIVGAIDGHILQSEDHSAHATGSGDVFFPNPHQTQGSDNGLIDNGDRNSAELEAQLITVELERLRDNSTLLQGDWADVTLPGGRDVPFASDANREYHYDRSDDRFEQVVVYHTLDQIQEYIHELGYDDDEGDPNGIRDFPTLANAHWDNDRNAFYSTGDDALHFGDSGSDDVDLAEDADIVAHEYGHAIQHDQNPNWGGGEMGAMGEGFSDYLAASFFADTGDPAYQAIHAASVAEWGFQSSLPGLRRVDSDKVYPDDLEGFVHSDGEIWSAALWEIRTQLGGETTDTIVLESHFTLPAGSSMVDGALAVLTADVNLNGGLNTEIIRNAFENRGILRAPDDHGNIALDATPIEVAASAAGVVDYGEDFDYFTFSTNANTTYELEVVADGPVNLQLAEADGTQVAFDSGESDPGTARLLWTATDTQSQFTRVSGTQSDVEYTFFINEADTPTDDHGSTANAATAVGQPSITDASLEVANDVDAFSFSVESGVVYEIVVERATLSDATLTILDSSGSQIESDVNGGIARSVIIPTTDTTYTALVGGFAQGSYRFSVGEIDDDHGNRLPDASVATVGGVTDGELEYLGDQDVFRFTASGNQTLSASIDLDTLADSELVLFSADGSEIDFDDDGGDGLGSRILWNALEGETYFLRAQAYADQSVGSYELRVEEFQDDHGDRIGDATPVEIPSTTDGRLEQFGDVDVFSFQARGGETYQFDVILDSLEDSILMLFDSVGDFLDTDDDGGPGRASRLIWRAPRSRTYYVDVSGFLFDSGSYRFRAKVFEPEVDDHGNDFDSSTLINLNSTSNGSIQENGDADFFSFVLDQPTDLIVETDLVTLGDSTLRLYDGDRLEIDFDDDGGVGLASRIQRLNAAAGTYFVEVRSFGSDTGEYELSVRSPQQSDDHGDTFEDATELVDIAVGEIQFSGDSDVFSITVPGPTELLAKVSLETLDDSALRLHDPAGELLEFDNDGGVGLASQIETTLPAAGTYFLAVSGFDNDTGSYELSVTTSSSSTLRCDLFDIGNGCNIDDLDSLYADFPPAPLTDELIDQWLEDASSPANPLKPNPSSRFVRGDVNLDGFVNSADLGLLLNQFNNRNVRWSSGNLNTDDVVNSADLGLLLNNFNFTSNQARRDE